MDLSRVVKAYDVRGTVPDELDEPIARALGAAFVDVTGAETVITAHDMRDTGPGLARAFADGAMHRGASIVEIGLASTDMLYFASGYLNLPGAMFTASHNPARYNGIKFCRAGAVAVGRDTGLADIRAAAENYLDHGLSGAAVSGTVEQRDLLADYAAYLRGLVDLSGIRPLKVVVDAGNGMGGFTVPAVLGTGAGLPALPLTVEPLYFELDGTFPHHEANPLEPEN